MNEEITVIKGIVEKITYRNESNGYTVAVVRASDESITVVGTFPFITKGETVVFKGKYTVHQTYGRQFSADFAERTTPETAAAILKYLSSGAIKGIGPATAVKIVEKFGKDTIDIIENHPNELSNIKGISVQKALEIGEEYKKQFKISDLMLMLSPYGFSAEKCVKIYKKLGKNCTEIIKDNPYILCGEDIGVSFESTERLAFGLGIEQNSEMRLTGGIEHIIRTNLSNGHTCLPRKKVEAVAVKLLDSDIARIESVIDKMILSMSLRSFNINEKEFLSLPQYFMSEQFISARLKAMEHSVSHSVDVDPLEIDYVENKLGIKFEEIQRLAVKNALKSGLFILTGGPGTGKTTTLNAIIELFERRRMSISLAAPTGRAAKRMTELTDREAKTVHRLLEVEWDTEDRQSFARNERNPLECDVLIIDEASMLDTLLFESVLRAVRITTRIILVGDVNQLPSIGAGNVLGDLISSEKFRTVELKKVFRQAKESSIVTNAHAIINGESCDLSNKNKDFFFIKTATHNDTLNTVLELCAERLPNSYGFDLFNNIQVICPSKMLETGTLNLNNLLQSCLNPDINKPQLTYKGVYFRTGDKVMQIKNDYDIEWVNDEGEKGYGVFNGDIGIIVSVERTLGKMEVKFDDRTATYFYEQLSELELGYAVTVHKSQGSEFDCVIVPLFSVPEKLRYRNLLYTAITRARKLLIAVGDKSVFYAMAENDRKTLRYTMLNAFLNDYD